MQIRQHVFVITGGAGGLGSAMAECLAKQGAQLALIDPESDSLKTVVVRCNQLGGTARSYVCDITDETAVERTFRKVKADFGAIHGLVNNAGIMNDGLLIKVKKTGN